MSWITKGTLDLLAIIEVPPIQNEDMSRSVIKRLQDLIKGHMGHHVTTPPLASKNSISETLSIRLKLNLNSLKASIPLYPAGFGYMNNALLRSLMTYMNAHSTQIPLEFHLNMDLQNFNGAWTFFDSGLVTAISDEISKLILRLFYDEKDQFHHLRKIGLWSLKYLSKGLMSLWNTIHLSHPLSDDTYGIPAF